MKLICQPRRFGKSLTVSTLSWTQYRESCSAVKCGEINYEQFDFSSVTEFEFWQDSTIAHFVYTNFTLWKFARRLQMHPDLDLYMMVMHMSYFADPKLAVDDMTNVVNEIHNSLSSVRGTPCSTMPNIFSNVNGYVITASCAMAFRFTYP